jgi:cell division protein FtsB
MIELTEKEAFQVGFVKRAAELGYTPVEAASLRKQAGIMEYLAPAVLLGVGLPALGGVATGTLQADLSDVTKEDVAREKQRQRIQTLLRESNAVNRHLKLLREQRQAQQAIVA